MRRKIIRPGDVFSIAFPNGRYGYGVRGAGADDCAFFNFSDDGAAKVAQLSGASVLFRVPVAKSAFQSDRWNYVGRMELPQALTQLPRYWQQAVGDNQLNLCVDGISFVPAKEEDLIGLERYSVWFDNNIEERLEANLAGRIPDIERRAKSISHYDPETGQLTGTSLLGESSA